ncbi:uncharacterized protein LOC129972648 [Argiope bruennichi]|uniref:uncharacterized protein LOC129972648 n=1 Tax=Argiope bruennichi TaxID=94029 RepID=UPI00249428FA|nr:uncharacterized protein LOC129972648 [Argiope bruennichi]
MISNHQDEENSQANDSKCEEAKILGVKQKISILENNTILAVINKILAEIDQRFSNDNKSIILGVRALVPGSSNFIEKKGVLPFAKLYEANIDNLSIELKNMENVMNRKSSNKPASLFHSSPKPFLNSIAYQELFVLHLIKICLYCTSSKVASIVHQKLPVLFLHAKVACTIPTCKRSFCTLQLVKKLLTNYYVR